LSGDFSGDTALAGLRQQRREMELFIAMQEQSLEIERKRQTFFGAFTERSLEQGIERAKLQLETINRDIATIEARNARPGGGPGGGGPGGGPLGAAGDKEKNIFQVTNPFRDLFPPGTFQDLVDPKKIAAELRAVMEQIRVETVSSGENLIFGEKELQEAIRNVKQFEEKLLRLGMSASPVLQDAFHSIERRVKFNLAEIDRKRKRDERLGPLQEQSNRSAFLLELEPGNQDLRLRALQDRVKLRLEEVRINGDILAQDQELERLTFQINKLLKERNQEGRTQERLGQGIVDQATRDFRLQGLTDAQRVEERALERLRGRTDDRGRPLFERGGASDLTFQRSILVARRNVAQEQFSQAEGGGEEFLHTIEMITQDIEALDKTIQDLPFRELEGNLQKVGSIVSDTFSTMVQGVLLGTQEIQVLWRQFLQNLAARLLDEAVRGGTSQLISLGIGALAAAAGSQSGDGANGAKPNIGAATSGNSGGIISSRGGGTLNLQALGGIVGPAGVMPLHRYAGGGIARSPQMALFGEGAQNEAFVPLPDGRRIPVSGGNTVVQIINNTGQPATQTETKSGDTTTIRAVIGDATNRDIRGRGPTAQLLERVYGLRRVGGGRN
jgi:hypothetical protein